MIEFKLSDRTSTSLLALQANLVPASTVSPVARPAAPNASMAISKPRPPETHAVTPDTLEGRIYDALANAKVQVSRVASHLPDNFRRQLFEQLDEVHDLDDWTPGDEPASPASFATFLRTLLLLAKSYQPFKWPGLGLSIRGHVLASWGTVADRLTLEFLGQDKVRWSLIRPDRESQKQTVIGECNILTLNNNLAPHAPEHWFHAR
jgi:hypothetical protein